MILDGSPNPLFTKIEYLNSQPLHLIENDTTFAKFSKTLLECTRSGDLQKLNNMDFESSKSIAKSKINDIFISVSGNWNFEAIRKLPWNLHNQGLNPIFVGANRNLIWQNEWKVFNRLSDKGVILPVDLMALARWQRNQSSWLKMSFRKGELNALEQLAAVYLMEIQVAAPYFIYERDIEQWNQWVVDGSLKFTSQMYNVNKD